MNEPTPHPAADRPSAPRWLRPAVDYGPLVVFFAGYFQFGLFAATAGLMGATVLALGISFVYERRLAMVPLVTAAVVGVFGGLTLWLHDETFIKLKPTIVQVLFAVVLFGGLVFRRSFLKSLLGTTISMDDRGWHILTVRYAWFFLAMAGLNEVVWRTQSTDFWVSFKVFGIVGLTVLFALSQVPVMTRHHLEKDVPEPGKESIPGDK
jgi:intracellular septation protein